MKKQTSLFLLCLVLAAGCKKNDAAAILDRGISVDMATLDTSTAKQAQVTFTPSHLRSAIMPNVQPHVSVVGYANIALRDVVLFCKSHFLLRDLTSKRQLSAKIEEDFTNSASAGLKIVPSSALIDGHEYEMAIDVAGAGFAITTSIRSRFHVGSLPRVSSVGFKMKETRVVGLTVYFSENVSPDAVASATRVQSNATIISMKKLGSALIANSVSFAFDIPSVADDMHTISVNQDVGAQSGALLDGKYSGKTGSGDFTTAIIPNQLQGRWIPEVESR
jgi:hypothetical protein